MSGFPESVLEKLFVNSAITSGGMRGLKDLAGLSFPLQNIIFIKMLVYCVQKIMVLFIDLFNQVSNVILV